MHEPSIERTSRAGRTVKGGTAAGTGTSSGRQGVHGPHFNEVPVGNPFLCDEIGRLECAAGPGRDPHGKVHRARSFAVENVREVPDRDRDLFRGVGTLDLPLFQVPGKFRFRGHSDHLLALSIFATANLSRRMFARAKARRKDLDKSLRANGEGAMKETNIPLRAIRKLKFPNGDDFAKAVGISSRGHLSDIENGKRPCPPLVAMRMAAVLGVSVHELGLGMPDLPEGLAFSTIPPLYRIPVEWCTVRQEFDEGVEMTSEPLSWVESETRDDIDAVMVEKAAPLPFPYAAGDVILFKRGLQPAHGDMVMMEFAGRACLKVWRVVGQIVLLDPVDKSDSKLRSTPMDDRWKVRGVEVKHIRQNVRGSHCS
jgi:transcriptional regulator with XRE-family HTH domain